MPRIALNLSGMYVLRSLFLFCLLSTVAFGQVQFEKSFLKSPQGKITQIESGDLDGDQLIDLVTLSVRNDQLAWLKNEGADQFSEATVLVWQWEQLSEFELIDLDLDGDLDIFLSGLHRNNLSNTTEFFAWYSNDGLGNFEEQFISLDITEFDELRLLDIDGDQDHEIVLTSNFFFFDPVIDFGYNTSIYIFENLGSGLFESPPSTEIIGEWNKDQFCFFDKDNDGDLDLFYRSWQNEASIQENTDDVFNLVFSGTPDFPSITEPLPVDVDADGDLDLICGGQGLTLVRNNGDDLFSVEEIPTGLSHYHKLCDVDGDGIKDIVYHQGPFSPLKEVNWMKLPLEDNEYVSEKLIENVFLGDLVIEDFDNDGLISLVIANNNLHTVQYSLEDEYDPITLVGAYEIGRDLRLADLNFDGLEDIILINEQNTSVEWRENLGNGSFAVPQEVWQGDTEILKVYAGNVYGDEQIEVIIVQQGKLVVSGGLSNPDFELEIPNLNSISDMQFMDYNGNGKNTMTLIGPAQLETFLEALTFIEIDPEQSISSFEMNSVESSAIGDLNNDGLADIVYTKIISGGRKLSVAYGSTIGAFDHVEIAGDLGLILGLVDVDQDGLLDFFLDDDSFVSLVRNLGETEFADPIIVRSTVIGHMRIFEDFNGNGRPDLMSFGSFISYDLLSEDLQTYESIRDFNYIPSSCCNGNFGVFDLEGDGDLDLVGVDDYSNRILFLENIPALPKARFELRQICPLELENFSEAYYPHTDFLWESNTGYSSQEAFSWTPSLELGEHTISLIACNELGCDTATQVLTEHILFEEPLIPTSGIVGQELDFQMNSPGATNWTWVFGDNETSTEENVTHVYTEAGTYTVEYYITNAGVADCTISGTAEITIESDIFVEDLSELTFTVSPNPARDYLYIHSQSMSNFNLSILNTTGSIELQIKSYDGGPLSIVHLAPGLYVLQIETPQGVANRKFVKLD